MNYEFTLKAYKNLEENEVMYIDANNWENAFQQIIEMGKEYTEPISNNNNIIIITKRRIK